MSTAMSTVEAIKTYFGDGSRPVQNAELLELKRGMKPEEWLAFGAAVCKVLGVEHKVS